MSLVTVTVKACESETVPSETLTSNSYTLSVFESPGISKSGAVLNVTLPVELMLNKLESAPEVIEKVNASPSLSVAVTKKAPVWFSTAE